MNYEWIGKIIQRTKPYFFPQNTLEDKSLPCYWQIVFLFHKLCYTLKRSIKHQTVYDSGQCSLQVRSTVNGTQPVKIKAQKKKTRDFFSDEAKFGLQTLTSKDNFFGNRASDVSVPNHVSHSVVWLSPISKITGTSSGIFICDPARFVRLIYRYINLELH